MRILIALAALFMVQLAAAQIEVVQKNYAYSGQELDIDVELGTEINIKSWDKQEISIKISYEVNGGEDNEAVSVDLDDHGKRLALDIEISERRLRKSNYCCCEKEDAVYWNGNNRSRNCIEMVVEVMIPTSADIRIKSVTSSVVIEGMSGNVEVETVTGRIDLSWEEGIGAEVVMKTTTGDLYTNIDLDRKKDKGLMQISGHDVEGRYMNGEKEVFLKTVTSDIYFRKPSD